MPKEYYIRQDVLRHIKGDFDTVMDDFTEESEKLSTMEDAAGEKLNHAFDLWRMYSRTVRRCLSLLQS